MKFRCERDVLLEALSNTQRAIPTRSGHGGTGGHLLDLSSDKLTVTGSDQDLTISSQITVAGEDDGSVVVPNKVLVDIVRSLDPGAVSFSTGENTAEIQSGRSTFSLKTYPATDYVVLPEPEGEEITIAAGAFEDGLKQVVRAASSDDARLVALTGVLIASEGQGLRMVSTDSYRLALRDLPGTVALREGDEVVVPSRALQELTRILKDDQDLTLVLSDRYAVFQTDTARLTTTLIEDSFPRYRTLIPESQPNRLEVDRLSFLDAVKRVRLMAQENKYASPTVKVSLSADQVRLSATTADVGEASEVIDGSYEGDEMEIAFNPEYLVDGLEICSGETVALNTTDEKKPALIRPVDSDDFLYLLMPIRVS